MVEVGVDTLINDGFKCIFDPARDFVQIGMQTSLPGKTKKQSSLRRKQTV